MPGGLASLGFLTLGGLHCRAWAFYHGLGSPSSVLCMSLVWVRWLAGRKGEVGSPATSTLLVRAVHAQDTGHRLDCEACVVH